MTGKTVPQMIRRIAQFMAAAVLAACSHHVPKHSSTVDLNLDFGGPPSVVSVEISGDLSRMKDYVVREMPEEFRSDPGSDTAWSFTRRSADLTLEEGRFRLTAELAGSVETKTFFQTCRLDPVYATVTVSMTPAITENEEGWVVGTKDADVDVALGPGSATTCTLFNIDVRSRLEEGLRGKKVKEKIREKIESAQVTIPRKKMNDLLNSPRSAGLAGGKTTLCVYPQVEKITVDTIEGSLEEAKLQAQATGHPFAVIDRRCPDSPAAPEITFETGDVAEGGRFIIAAGVAVPYDELTRQLSALEGQEFDVEGKKFYIKDIYAANASGRLLVGITTLGYINGMIWIWGTPVFDGGCSRIRLDKVDYAAKSGDWLDSAKIALGSLTRGRVVKKIASKAVFDISRQCEDLRSSLQGEHAVKGATVSISADRVVADGPIRSRDDAVVGRITVSGEASAALGF
jgi:hypothetical protein